MGDLLKGRVAIVTGGGQGLGKAICLRFSEEGAKVMVADVNPATAQVTASALREKGSIVSSIQVDVTKAAEVQKMIEKTLAEFKQIDILVNNAGIHRFNPFLEQSEEDWDAVIQINLKGPFLCSQAVAREMVRAGKGGKIVNMASVAGIVAVAGQTPYEASKAGLSMLTRGMALELASHKINVNAIAPATTQTEMTRFRFEDPKQLAWVIGNIPLGRAGQPADVANAALFLASPGSDFITGHTLVVDGGWTIK
jgi:NAD(P)-dependent dehydrogenase (short-subunit alcohol dehydrogenase family)